MPLLCSGICPSSVKIALPELSDVEDGGSFELARVRQSTLCVSRNVFLVQGSTQDGLGNDENESIFFFGGDFWQRTFRTAYAHLQATD